MPAGLAIHRFSARTPARAQPVAARLALQALGADLEDALPRSLPPQALLWLRRLQLQAPEAALLRPAPAAWRQDWIAAGRERLAAALAQAARPALGPVPESAPAVLFADAAEMLACLALAAQAGQMDRWWWRGLLGRAWPQWETAWVARPEAQAGAMRLLARMGQGGAVAAWSEWPAVMRVPSKAMTTDVDGPPARTRPSEDPRATVDEIRPGMTLAAEASVPAMSVFSHSESVAGPQPHRVAAPGVELARAAQSWPCADELPTATARQLVEAVLPASAQIARVGHQPIAEGSTAEPVAGAPSSSAAPSQQRITPATPLHRASVVPPAAQASGSPGLAAAEPAPASVPQTAGAVPLKPAATTETATGPARPAIEAEAVASASVAPRSRPVGTIPRELASPEANAPIEAGASSWPWPQAVLSRQLPLLFIVNALLEDGLYPDFTRPRDPGLPVPLWALLAALARAWRLPADELQAVLQLRCPDWTPPELMPAVPGTSSGAWPEWLAAYARSLRRRLCRRLGLRPAAWPQALTLARPARLWLSEAEWVAEFDLGAHDVAWRLAGLDRDPGWLPSAGCTLRFVFHS